MTEESEEEEKKFWRKTNIFFLILFSPVILPLFVVRFIGNMLSLIIFPILIAFMSVEGFLWIGGWMGFIWLLLLSSIFFIYVLLEFGEGDKWVTFSQAFFLLLFLLEMALFYPPFMALFHPSDATQSTFTNQGEFNVIILRLVVTGILGISMMVKRSSRKKNQDETAQDNQDEIAQD